MPKVKTFVYKHLNIIQCNIIFNLDVSVIISLTLKKILSKIFLNDVCRLTDILNVSLLTIKKFENSLFKHN